MINRALLIKSNKVTVSAGNASEYNKEIIPDLSQLTVFCAEHGYGLSEDLVKEFCRMPRETFDAAAKELVEQLSAMSFDILKDAKTFYENFPADPLALRPEERLGYQVAYYLFGDVVKTYLPEKDASSLELKPLKSESKMLSLGTVEDVVNLYRRMMGSPVSVSPQDCEFLEKAFSGDKRIILKAIPARMPNKENFAFVAAKVLKHFPERLKEICGENFRTATDVLRVIACLNGYSATLKEEKWKCKPMSRKMRRALFAILDQCGNVEQDMKRQIDKWKSVAYRYHPFEYVKSKACRQAFDHLYKGELEKSFSAEVEAAMASRNLEATLALLEKRPGEFVRRMDALLSLFSTNAVKVIDTFSSIPAEKFEPKLLLQLASHFEARTGQKEYSLYLPRGGASGVYAKPDNRLPVSPLTAARIKEICETKIKEIFALKPAMGKVYLDDSIKGYKVPLQQRNNSKMGIRVPAKGSRIKSDPEKDVVRTFIWWTNEESGRRVDVDLSLNLYNEQMVRMETYYYGNFFSNTSASMVSSGDITDGGPFGGKGVAEFLDFSRSAMLDQGYRYIQVCVNVFSANHFNAFPCKFGFMQRDEINKEVPFEPSTLEGTIDISSEGTNYSPVVYDVQTGEFIWIDVTGLGKTGKIINTNGQAVAFNSALYMATHNEIPELYDLVRLNAEVRGEIVASKEEADVIYSLREGITPYDLDIISADLLAKEVAEEKPEKETAEAPVKSEEPEKPEETEKTAEPLPEKKAVSAAVPVKAAPDENFIRFLTEPAESGAEEGKTAPDRSEETADAVGMPVSEETQGTAESGEPPVTGETETTAEAARTAETAENPADEKEIAEKPAKEGSAINKEQQPSKGLMGYFRKVFRGR